MSESDRIDFWWDEDAQQYIEGSRYGPTRRGPKMVEYVQTSVKTMNDQGTRFIHLAEFQDYLSDGLVAVTNSLTRYANGADIARQKSLEAALELLKIYQYSLSGYDRKKFDFNQMLDANVPSKAVLDEIKKERAAAKADAQENK